MNISSDTVTMYKNTTVGQLTPVDELYPPPLEQQFAAPGGGVNGQREVTLEQQVVAPGSNLAQMNSKVPSHNTLEQQFVAPGVEDLQIDKDLEPKQRKEMEDLLKGPTI